MNNEKPTAEVLKTLFLIPKEIYLGFVKIEKAATVYAAIKY